MNFPQGWDELEEGVGSDAMVIAYDLAHNTVIARKSFGRTIIPDLPEGDIGPEYILHRVHPDDHPALLEALENSAALKEGQTTSYRLRIAMNGDYKTLCFRTSPLLADRLGDVFVVRTLIYPD
jgi:hypothetical protein